MGERKRYEPAEFVVLGFQEHHRYGIPEAYSQEIYLQDAKGFVAVKINLADASHDE